MTCNPHIRRGPFLAGAASLAIALAVSLAPTRAAAEIRIGVFGPMTGDAAGYGNSLREAVDLFVEDVNNSGGIKGEQISVVYGDDAGKPEQAVSVAKRLTTRDNVLIMLGSISSPASLAASQVAEQDETGQIVISGTAQRITTQGNPWVFRSAVPDTKLAGDLVDFMHEHFPEITKVGFIYVNDDFGKGGFDSYKKRADELGIEIVAEERYTRGDLDFTSQLSRIRASGAQAMIDWSRYTEGSLIAKQTVQMGLDIPRFGSDGHAHPRFRELAGDAANGWYYPTHFSVATAGGIAAAKEFIAKIDAAYDKEPDYVHAQAWDAITATAMAIEQADEISRAAVRDALREVKFDGVRGPFAFDEKGDPTLVTHMVLVVDGQETDARAKTQ